jgi:hypothetical protein
MRRHGPPPRTRPADRPPNQACPDRGAWQLADNATMNANADRFPLLRFFGWFAALLLAATALAVLIAQSEVEAAAHAAPAAAAPASTTAAAPPARAADDAR